MPSTTLTRWVNDMDGLEEISLRPFADFVEKNVLPCVVKEGCVATCCFDNEV